MLELYSKKNSRVMRPLQCSYIKLDKVDDEKNGILVKRSVFKEFDFSLGFSNIHYADFGLSNILAVGATHLLRPCMMKNLDFSGSANAFDTLYQKLVNDESSKQTSEK